jgi:hypothetical protein
VEAEKARYGKSVFFLLVTFVGCPLGQQPTKLVKKLMARMPIVAKYPNGIRENIFSFILLQKSTI